MARRQERSLRRIMPHLDDLTPPTFRAGIQIQRIMVSGTVVGKWNPQRTPPFLNGESRGIRLTVFEVPAVEKIVPNLLLPNDALER